MRAKVETVKLGPALANEAQRAREALAAKVYALDAVKAACLDAATKGFSTLTLPPPAPVDLARTEAGSAARAWLMKEGVRAVWENRTMPATGETFPVLVISWD
jgi:hypothetical protein